MFAKQLVKTIICLSLFGSVAWAGDGLRKATSSATSTLMISAMLNQQLSDKAKKPCLSFQNAMMCMVMGLSAAQVIVDIAGAGGADEQTKKVSTGDDFGPPEVTPPDLAPPDPEGARTKLKELKKLGYEFDTKTGKVKTPKGTADANMLQSGQALADAGLIDPNDAGKYDKIMASVKDKIKMSMSSGGAAGGYTRKPSSTSEGDMDFDFGRPKAQIQAAKTSGLSKNFGNDPIGISTDNLFDMVHRRYRTLDSKSNFIRE